MKADIQIKCNLSMVNERSDKPVAPRVVDCYGADLSDLLDQIISAAGAEWVQAKLEQATGQAMVPATMR